MSDYYNVTTNNGDAAIAAAIANATKLNITHIAFGDGNGAVPTPNKARTTLINEVHRQAVSKYSAHPTIANYLVVEAIIPSDVGGFWIREIGLIADGILISHGSHAPFFKVAETDGVSEFRLKYTIDIQDGGVVELTLDESLIHATQAWTNENYIPRDELGAADGAAKLDTNGKVIDEQLKLASTAQAGIVKLVNNLLTGGTDKALTAEQGRILNDQAFGVGQTRKTVTRVKGVTYTNTTPRIIIVFAYFTSGAYNHDVRLTCGGYVVDLIEVQGSGGSTTVTKTLSVRGEVLPGETYVFDSNHASVNIVYAGELS